MKTLYKIFKLFFYIFIGYPLFALSHLMKRSSKLWVVGGQHGFRDNSKYFAIYLSNNHPEIKTVWIANNHKEAMIINRLGVKSYSRWSIKGLLTSLRAKVYIFDSYVSNVNLWTSGNAIKFNLWHGIGIKNIERGATQGVTKKIFKDNSLLRKFLHPANHIRPSIFLSTSEFMTNHFQKAFDITKSQCLESIYPRCEIFFWTEKKFNNHLSKYESKELTSLYEKIKLFENSYIYMPTWRDDGKDFLKKAQIDLRKINQLMVETNSIFIFKLHPNTQISIRDFSSKKYPNIIFLSKTLDVYPLLRITKTLITDYSSIYYDFILMKEKEVILFPFDLEDYLANNRDLAFDYNTYTPGIKALNFEELLYYLKTKPLNDKTKIDSIRQLFWNNSYKKSNADTYSKLIKAIE